MTDFLALMFVMFSCVFATYPYGVPGQVWFLIVSISDTCICLPPYIVLQYLVYFQDFCNHLVEGE